MNGISRYVTRQLLIGLAFVAGALTCVIWLIQSLRFVEMIVNRGLSVGDFLYLTMLLLPNFLAIILPIAFFIVVVFVYNRLTQDRELVVMRSIGMSQLALAQPAMIVGVIVMLTILVVNLWLLPASYSAFRDLQWEMRNSFHILLREGTFNEVGPDTTVYIRERKPDGQLVGIFVHDESDAEAPYSLLAERGGLVETETGARVVMFNGNRQEVDKVTNQLSILYFDRYTHDLNSDREVAGERHRGRRERSLLELLDSESDTTLMEHQIPQFVTEAHRRIIKSVSTFGFTIIALACLLSGGFSRRNQNIRILVAVTIFVGLNILLLGLENMSSRNLAIVPALYAAALLPIPLGLWYLTRPPGSLIRRRTPQPAGYA